jgi:hypothetical protein
MAAGGRRKGAVRLYYQLLWACGKAADKIAEFGNVIETPSLKGTLCQVSAIGPREFLRNSLEALIYERAIFTPAILIHARFLYG